MTVAATECQATWPEVDLLLRKSKKVEDGTRTLSIRAQEERGRAWAAENKFRVRRVWKENLSAWSDVKRPQYDAAMTAVLNGEVGVLWVYALDRFSRKGAEAVVPILGKARIIFDYECLDSMNERDRRWIIDRAENAREYSERLAYNVKSTKSTQRNEGRWSAKAPYGLQVDPKTRKLSPDREILPGFSVSAWDVICRIFTSIAAGVSARKTALALDTEGFRSPRGKAWSGATIAYIIKNPIYEGWQVVSAASRTVRFLLPNGEPVHVVPNTVVPEMISADLAGRARRVLDGNQFIIGNAPVPGRVSAPLTGLSRCASCGSAASRKGASYMCIRIKDAGTGCAAPGSVLRTSLEKYVVELWAARLKHADEDDPILIAVAQRWAAVQHPDETQNAQDARASLKVAETNLTKFHERVQAGFYDGPSSRFMIPAKQEAESAVLAAQEHVQSLGVLTVDITFLREGDPAAAYKAASDQLRRELLRLAINKVSINRGQRGKRFVGADRVKIDWVTPYADEGQDVYEAAA